MVRHMPFEQRGDVFGNRPILSMGLDDDPLE
jgi:hypothetical protein